VTTARSLFSPVARRLSCARLCFGSPITPAANTAKGRFEEVESLERAEFMGGSTMKPATVRALPIPKFAGDSSGRSEEARCSAGTRVRLRTGSVFANSRTRRRRRPSRRRLGQ